MWRNERIDKGINNFFFGRPKTTRVLCGINRMDNTKASKWTTRCDSKLRIYLDILIEHVKSLFFRPLQIMSKCQSFDAWRETVFHSLLYCCVTCINRPLIVIIAVRLKIYRNSISIPFLWDLFEFIKQILMLMADLHNDVIYYHYQNALCFFSCDVISVNCFC